MTKEMLLARIAGNEEILTGIYRMTLECGSVASLAQPGQFINLYLNDKSMLLPRPISICRAETDRIELIYRVVGKGTDALAEYRQGDSVKMSTPLGRGYYLKEMYETLEGFKTETVTIALAAGGLGVPPMVYLAESIRKRIGESVGKGEDCGGINGQKVRIIAALGYQDQTFLTEELASFCDEIHIATDSGSSGFRGTVLDMMRTQELGVDYCLSCGPKPMLRSLSAFCAEKNIPLQVSLEERMGCGYGACVGCTCKTKEIVQGAEIVKQKKVCKDGPVFFGDEVIWDA